MISAGSATHRQDFDGKCKVWILVLPQVRGVNALMDSEKWIGAVPNNGRHRPCAPFVLGKTRRVVETEVHGEHYRSQLTSSSSCQVKTDPIDLLQGVQMADREIDSVRPRRSNPPDARMKVVECPLNPALHRCCPPCSYDDLQK